MEAIKSKLSKGKTYFVSFGEWMSEKYHNHKKKCFGTILTLSLLGLLAGLIVGSFKHVDSLSQGTPINYTSGIIVDSSFIGLNTYYKTVPNINFLISFEIAKQNSKYSFAPIKARVIEGTLLQMQVYAKVKLSTSNLKGFFEDYGFESIDNYDAWLIYIKEKIKNVVTQQVALFRFYQISNKALSDAINKHFMAYETNTTLSFPFIVRIISINVHYPDQNLKSKDTLGVRLLQQQSRLSQLATQLGQVQGYITQYSNQTTSYAEKRGQIEGQMASRENAVKLSSNYWTQGIQVFNKAVNGNSTLLQKYLQIYFNTLYNVTYRIQSLQPFQI